MATYSADVSATTIPTGCRLSINSPVGFDSYLTTRSFWKFDLTGSGYTSSQIASAKVTFYCTATTGGGLTDFHLYTGSSGDNWGTSLTADFTDFNSTRVNLEYNGSFTSTGSKDISITKTNIDYNDWNYIACTAGSLEGTGGGSYTYTTTIASQNHGTTAWRPLLTLTLAGGGVCLLPLLGVGGSGGGGGNVTYAESTADGYCRRTDVVASGITPDIENP